MTSDKIKVAIDLQRVESPAEIEKLGALGRLIFHLLECDAEEVFDLFDERLIHEGIHLLVQVVLVGLLDGAARVLSYHVHACVVCHLVLHATSLNTFTRVVMLILVRKMALLSELTSCGVVRVCLFGLVNQWAL